MKGLLLAVSVLSSLSVQAKTVEGVEVYDLSKGASLVLCARAARNVVADSEGLGLRDIASHWDAYQRYFEGEYSKLKEEPIAKMNAALDKIIPSEYEIGTHYFIHIVSTGLGERTCLTYLEEERR